MSMSVADGPPVANLVELVLPTGAVTLPIAQPRLPNALALGALELDDGAVLFVLGRRRRRSHSLTARCCRTLELIASIGAVRGAVTLPPEGDALLVRGTLEHPVFAVAVRERWRRHVRRGRGFVKGAVDFVASIRAVGFVVAAI